MAWIRAMGGGSKEEKLNFLKKDVSTWSFYRSAENDSGRSDGVVLSDGKLIFTAQKMKSDLAYCSMDSESFIPESGQILRLNGNFVSVSQNYGGSVMLVTSSGAVEVKGANSRNFSLNKDIDLSSYVGQRISVRILLYCGCAYTNSDYTQMQFTKMEVTK